MMHQPPVRQVKRLLIANRGEIAIRILSTARELGIETFTLYTDNDTSHTVNSAHAIQLASPASYLNIAEIIELVKVHNIDSVHPGYGFLSESPEFARRMWQEAKAVVIGPGWEVLARTGDKLQARLLAEECKVPVLQALKTPTDDIEEIRHFGASVGYPIVIKAVDGGGGRGIRIVREVDELANMMERALRESPCKKVFAEKAAIDGFRHIEVQIVGDGQSVRHLWERECSIQRRFQKVVEFAPSSIRDRELVTKVIESSLRMAKKVRYTSLGTFEFLVRSSPPEFYFLEVNPRLQVEHTITESICMGIDLVKIQLLIACGQPLSLLLSHLSEDPRTPPPLHSLQLRVTAENASHDWSLSVGKIASFKMPSGNGIRIDTNLVSSMVVKTDFDSLLAKIVVTAPSWEDVVNKSRRALADTSVDGIKTSLDALRGIISSSSFLEQKCDTLWLEASLSQVLEAGELITRDLTKRTVINSSSSHASSVAGSVSSVLLRKGDKWSIMLHPDSSSSKENSSPNVIAPGHLELTRVMRNEFPASLVASVLYTDSGGSTVPYTLSLNSTTTSAGALTSTSKHRRGDPSNSNHIIIPFPGQLMEVLVDEGDIIAKEDVIAVVRQMKMELEIRSPKAGRVTWLFEVEDGEEVGEGILVAEIKDDMSGASKL